MFAILPFRNPAMTDLYRQLLFQLEIDRDLGIHFLPRKASQEAASAQENVSTQTNVVAYPSAPSSGSKSKRLQALATHIAACERCALCSKRTQTVAGEGNPDTELMFVGEGPGAEEDKQGRPFVGAAGQLLDKMINAMGFARSDVFIANIIKCRPPGNRTPEEDETATCMPWLEQQINIIQPKIICTLGNTPLRALCGDPKAGITRQRGKLFRWQDIPVIPTFHPSYLLRNQEAKKPCWDDLKAVLQELGRDIPER